SEEFRTAVVVGAGTAGSRVAAALARAGVAVTVAGHVDGGDRRSAGPDRTRPTALPPADLVVEAVPEDVATKRTVHAVLGRVYGLETVVASTASAVPLAELATAAG